MDRLRKSYQDLPEGNYFDELIDMLSGEEQRIRYRDIARQRKTTEAEIWREARRFRSKFGCVLIEEVSRTVMTDFDVSQELRALGDALKNSRPLCGTKLTPTECSSLKVCPRGLMELGIQLEVLAAAHKKFKSRFVAGPR